jgi:predicted acyltransferase
MLPARSAPSVQNEPPPGPPRLVSLDALRGFDMIWIIGADAVGSALSRFQGGPVVRFFATQMEHTDWDGFHFYDLIFPLFVFMVGMAVTLSLDRIVEKEGRGAALRRIFKRGVLLYVLGLLYYGGIAEGFAHVRWLGVLQRLAICYVATSLLYLCLKPRALVVVFVALLAGYWALLTFVPVPGFGAGDFARGHNLANWIDAHYLPGKLWYGDYDPEGLLSTLPAIASCLLGLFAALVLRDAHRWPPQKLRRLVFGGVALIALGWLWHLQFPVNKRLWTSSFVLVSGGWSVLLLAAFYYTIDLRGWRKWAEPFVWVGSNALTIYLISHLVDFGNLSARFLGGEIAATLDALWPGLSSVVLAFVGITLCVAVCRFLYLRKIFIRL